MIEALGLTINSHTNEMLAPKKSTNWDPMIEALRLTINSHTMRILFPREKANDIKRLLLGQWPSSREKAGVCEGRSQHGGEAVGPHVRTASGQVYRKEAVATDQIIPCKR